jgi:hypothetical protein
MFSKDILKQPTIFTLLRVTAICWLIAKLISWKVWLPYRLFPVIPPAEWLHVPSTIHLLLFFISLICLFAIIIFPRKQKIWQLLLIAELCSCVLDQNRWQPWEYQYLFTLFIFIVYKNKTELILPSIACILIATYFYSAANKFNNGFLMRVWSNLILKDYLKINEVNTQNYTLHYAGYLLPLIELTCCIGLLFSLTKKIAAYVLIAMHVFILIMLGPFGLHYNKIVWPWNAAMIIFLWIIFIKHEINTKVTWIKTNRIVAVCWIILPALHFGGWWDSYLSCSLYSGNTSLMMICVQDSSTNVTIAKYFNRGTLYNGCKNGHQLSIQNWALEEMNVPAYPEERIYAKIKQDWLNKYPSLHAEFYIRHSLTIQSGHLLTGIEHYIKMH